MLNLNIPEHAYFFGLLQADGHHQVSTRNRGKISLELSQRDEEILFRVAELLPVNYSITTRTRNTNFKQEYTTVCLSIYDLQFRMAILELGLPIGKKDMCIALPFVSYSEIDYWRGYIDGNGSLGITSKGFPYISLVIKSEVQKEAYLDFLFRHIGCKKKVNRNKRDQIYNISLYKEDAQKLISLLYYDNSLALKRKAASAHEALKWVRPENMPRRFK